MTENTKRPARLYLANLAPGSRETQENALHLVAKILTDGRKDGFSFPWHTVTAADAEAVRAWLIQNRAPATGRRVIAALKGTLRMAWRLGQISAEHRERVCDLQRIRGASTPPGRAITQEELAALLAVCECDSTDKGVRDGALIALLFGSGLRRFEAAALDVRSFSADDREIRVDHGKGARGRRVLIPSWVAERISRWLNVRGRRPGRLFKKVTSGGRVTSQGIRGATIAGVLDCRCAAAGIARITPHDLRRSYVTELLDRGADLHVVQQLAGHASSDTTARYDRRGRSAQRRAADLLEDPGGSDD